MVKYSTTIFSLEVAIVIVLVIVGFVFLFRRIRKEKKLIAEEKTEEKKTEAPKSVKPAFFSSVQQIQQPRP